MTINPPVVVGVGCISLIVVPFGAEWTSGGASEQVEPVSGVWRCRADEITFGTRDRAVVAIRRRARAR